MNIMKGIGGLVQSMAKTVKKEETPEVTKEHHGANKLSGSMKKSMATRIASAVVGLLILIPCLFIGDWLYLGAMVFFLAIACWEILGCSRKRTIGIFITYFLFILLIALWPMFKSLAEGTIAFNGRIDAYFSKIYITIIVFAVLTFFLFFLTVIYKDFTVHDATFLITMGVLIGLGFQCLLYLRFLPMTAFAIQTTGAFDLSAEAVVRPSILIVFVIFATFMTDTGAYFVGVFFGKTRMNERISPKKTWEGFVGGVVISAVLSSVAGILLAYFDYPLLPFLDLSHWYLIVLFSLLLPFFATLGDFVFSSIKRSWGIKDYGRLIPGHGGVLDRLDSIIFAAIMSSIFVFMVSTVLAGNFNWVEFLV